MEKGLIVRLLCSTGLAGQGSTAPRPLLACTSYLTCAKRQPFARQHSDCTLGIARSSAVSRRRHARQDLQARKPRCASCHCPELVECRQLGGLPTWHHCMHVSGSVQPAEKAGKVIRLMPTLPVSAAGEALLLCGFRHETCNTHNMIRGLSRWCALLLQRGMPQW